MGKVIVIDKAEQGMILDEPILNNFGQTLLPSGIELSQNHINMLKAWNINSLSIRTDSSGEPEYSKEMKRIAEKYIRQVIEWEPEYPQEKDIFNIALYAFIDTNLRRNESND